MRRRGISSATSRRITRTVADGPSVAVAVDAQPVAVGARERRAGGAVAVAGVFEAADFGFEFAAFVLLDLVGCC